MTETNTSSQESATVNALASAAKARRRPTGPSWMATIAIVLLLLVILLATGAWHLQKRYDNVGREVATQIQLFNNQVSEARAQARQAITLADAHAVRIALLESSLRETQNQYSLLEQAWESFNKGMEDSMLASDLERLLSLASQQLRLSGSVNNAIMALEAALSTLVRADRPKFSAVQRAISTDLDRLRAAPVIDVAAISARLDSLNSLITRAPLLVPDLKANSVQDLNAVARNATANEQAASSGTQTAPVIQSAGANDQSLSWWESAWIRSSDWVLQSSKKLMTSLGRELSGVISIQRVNDASALLMSPEQGAQMRANLRSRVLTAQMALLMHQPAIWRSELAAIESSLNTRFDPKAVDTIAALGVVRELAAASISVAVPDIVDSIAALEAVRVSEVGSKSGN
ncbi:heme biosynthesis operon protein HemX [Orrella sp. NBD-18]|uniref:Heme biosynthesis operon protein HemX n=1 Tax=Sheuella amnicola TaxID=2707330 RepID=A0A6B2QY74_9BURK|nr:uroporphyrinogen-III C-methyltransferase [Sheuella amnicola]NDY81677.1 heme biosynthesis operon protein HemX [Sheuella amnicola]